MFVQTLQKRQGLHIACLEEIAYDRGFITHEEFVTLGKNREKFLRSISVKSGKRKTVSEASLTNRLGRLFYIEALRTGSG